MEAYEEMAAAFSVPSNFSLLFSSPTFFYALVLLALVILLWIDRQFNGK